ncbi:hypothetical protein THRCLA_20578 [Thraustotheca clavata]|uniref:Uncharacterized protein n=1 Tax=Thraustotheca clavata TaxID=74557 RepID=A0A1W0A6D3_9STRA|nr:hypothetical protein THRCLA_20578 [Thraustotheca clavata]
MATSWPLGVTLSFLDEFIASHGGVDAFRNLTTRQVNINFLLPLTATSKLSLVDQLTISCPSVQPARWYVSHAWPYMFLDVIESLHLFFSDKPSQEAIVWFDLFCNSQHTNTDFNSLTSIICRAITSIQRVVMVLLPWDRPIPLTRAWCVYEVYMTVNTASEFQVAMTQQETDRFADNVSVDAFFDMLAHVKSEASDSYDPQDKIQIAKVIENTIGFKNMDTMVFRVFENWMTSTLTTKISISNGPTQSIWQFKLGSLYQVQGKYDLAETMFVNCVAARKLVLGEEHPDTLSALSHMASLYKAQGKYAQAESILEQCSQVLSRLKLHDSPLGLVVADTLAGTVQCQGKYAEAETLYLQCLAEKKRIMGERHTSTMLTMGNLASLYQAQGKYEAAKPFYELCVACSIATVGDDNPNTITLKNNLAANLNYLHDYQAAEALYVQCLSDGERILGKDHPSTLTTMNNLAANYYHQHKLDVAEALYEKCIAASKLVLGEAHPHTLSAMNNLAALLKDAQKYEAAEALYKECVEMNTKTMGPAHPSTLTSMNNLACLYERQGKLNEAVTLLVPVLERRRQVLPGDHPSLLNSIRELGLLYEKLHDFTSSEPLLIEYVAIQTRRVGPHHNDTILRKRSLAEHYCKIKNPQAAETLLLECVEGAKITYGVDAPETIKLTNKLEAFYLDQITKSLELKEWADMAQYIASITSFGKTNPLSETTRKEVESLRLQMPMGTPRRVVKSLA